MDDKSVSASTPASLKSITLNRSKILVQWDEDYSTADVVSAQKAAGKEPGMFALYLAQRIATFDGAKLKMGDIQGKIKGRDYLQLSGAILGDSDEDASGN